MTYPCPTCGLPALATCVCPLQDSKCQKGHWWHLCPTHGTLISGRPDHHRPATLCHCPLASLAEQAQETTTGCPHCKELWQELQTARKHLERLQSLENAVLKIVQHWLAEEVTKEEPCPPTSIS